MDLLQQSSSQVTLVNPQVDNETTLIMLLNPDNVKRTTMTRLGSPGEVLYRVQSNAAFTKCSVFRSESDSEPIAVIERRDIFPDRITLEGQERVTIKSWLRGYGTFKDFPISFEHDGQLYHWKKNVVDQVALFHDGDSEHPIAWFERSKRRVVDGVPTIIQAWLAIEREALAIRDTVVVSFLIVEHKIRTGINAGGLGGGREGRGASYVV